MSARALSFPKSKRLTRAAEFARVKKEGRTERGQFVMLSVIETGETFRAGFITSKRIGGAVVRNRVRRRLREVVRRNQNKIEKGFWTVTIARPRAAGASFAQLEDEWLRLAERASILAR